jgi:putative membrane protein
MTQDDDSGQPRTMDAGTAMAADRTAMAFSRTAMASDRTLMAVARTSLSFIGFGFTIFQFFHTLNDKYLGGALPAEAPRRFGIALIVLGVILLLLGILNRRQEAQALRLRRQDLVDDGLLQHPESKYPSSSMVIAILLLLLGLLAILSVGFRIGPF